MNRKPVLWALVAAVGLVAMSVATVFAIRVPFSYRDREWLARLGELFLPVLDPGDTKYSSGFNEEVFAKITVGARKQDVLEKLGEPLDRKSFPEPIMKKAFPNGGEAWYYSRHGPESKSYFVRVIVFDGQGRVARKSRYYYVD
ncbi:MAG TPA: hypothetical protein VF789_06570 [Thermoanaerobaculia bacterium]